MDQEYPRRGAAHVTARVRQLSEDITNSENPSVQIVFELMTAREMLVGMENAESSETRIQQCIDQIDELMVRWDAKLGDTIGEQS